MTNEEKQNALRRIDSLAFEAQQQINQVKRNGNPAAAATLACNLDKIQQLAGKLLSCQDS